MTPRLRHVALAALLCLATPDVRAQQTQSPDLLQSPSSQQQAPVQQQWLQDNQAPQSSPGAPQSDQQGSDQSNDQDGDQSASQPPPPQGPATFSRPNVWVPATTVRLQALDKVNAQSGNLTIKVGQSATYGSLTITVKACVVRPSDQPADAAAFLDVKDSHPDSGNFAGWMLANEPDVSMMQNPIYDLRVIGCT